MSATRRLSELIRIPTVSAINPAEENEEIFSGFPDRLAAIYPKAHGAMEREICGRRGILYRWDGTRPDLEPVLGLAHFDVVPPGDEDVWIHPPFDGVVAEGRIHGRGSLDDKGMLASWMEAVGRLAAAGFRPERTLYLAFSGDEESTGTRGAGHMAGVLTERGIRFACILDEGGALAVDQLSGFTDRPVALVGIAEKGYLTLRITAAGMSGHAAAPPKHTAIGRLSQSLAALESRPAAPRLTEAPIGMLRALGRAGGGFKGFILRHPRLFSPFILRIFSSSPATDRLVRTTLAPTIVHGGDRENVLPDRVEAMVNLRLLPGDSVAGPVSRVESIISRAVDGGVSVEPVEGSVFEPVPACANSGLWWDMITHLIQEYYPGSVVAPYLMTGTTDSRWYRHLSDAIFRFIPMPVDSEEMSHVHSENESISEAKWLKSIDFLESFLTKALKEKTS